MGGEGGQYKRSLYDTHEEVECGRERMKWVSYK
nr:MAG TPA: Sirohem biosynthesis protein [Caudoviricetes sp.]